MAVERGGKRQPASTSQSARLGLALSWQHGSGGDRSHSSALAALHELDRTSYMNLSSQKACRSLLDMLGSLQAVSENVGQAVDLLRDLLSQQEAELRAKQSRLWRQSRVWLPHERICECCFLLI